MTFTVGTLTLCSGGNHVNVPVTIGGTQHTLKFLRSELGLDLNGFEEAKEAILARLRSAAKEAGAATNAQIKAAVEGKTFQI